MSGNMGYAPAAGQYAAAAAPDPTTADVAATQNPDDIRARLNDE